MIFLFHCYYNVNNINNLKLIKFDKCRQLNIFYERLFDMLGFNDYGEGSFTFI